MGLLQRSLLGGVEAGKGAEPFLAGHQALLPTGLPSVSPRGPCGPQELRPEASSELSLL